MDSRFVVGMMKRLLILELKGKLNLDGHQAYDLLVKLGIRGSLANDTSKEIVLFNKQYCRHCGRISINEVGSPFIFVGVCSHCVAEVNTYYSLELRNPYHIAGQLINLPANIRKEIVNNLLEDLADGL